MKKRIISGVLLACIIVPTVFWAFDLIKVSVKPNSIASTIYDWSYALKKLTLDLAIESKREGLEKEDEEIAADSAAIQQDLTLLPDDGGLLHSEKSRALHSELGEVLNRRGSNLDANKEQLLAMEKEQVAAERYFLEQFRREALKTEWQALSRIIRTETNIARHANRLQHKDAAAVVNQFIDAVAEMNVDQVKELSATALRKELGLARVRTMRRNTPAELESGFELREAGKNRLDVWAGSKVATLCSQHDGSWLFEEAWE
jgi:hypothetical protein